MTVPKLKPIVEKKELALFQQYPALLETIACIPLVKGFSPLLRAVELEKELHLGQLWIKCDQENGLLYGGNKPRKLAFLLGDAQQKGYKEVMTFGALSSNHSLATALYAKALDMDSILVLVDKPVHASTRTHLLASLQMGAQLIHAKHTAGAIFHGLKSLLLPFYRKHWKLPYLIMPGGSTPLGTLGFVDAGLELFLQVEQGIMETPDVLFVPVGSNGSMAGLLVAQELLGSSVQIMGVLVSDVSSVSQKGVAGLASSTWKLLKQRGLPLQDKKWKASDVCLLQEHLGPGYSFSTPEAEEAVILAQKSLQLQLEVVYSGKTLAGLLSEAHLGNLSGKKVVFWNTYNALSVESWIPSDSKHTLQPSIESFLSKGK